MDKKDILEFINSCKIFHLATVEGDKPHVRAMMLYRADEKGIIFHTGKTKDLNKQLCANPKVELCFNNFQKNIQIRVVGFVVPVESLELKKEIVSKREFLKPWIEEFGFELFAVYCVKSATATIWTFETNFAPKSYIEL